MYTADSNGVNGGAVLGSGLLLDTGGSDAFADAEGACANPDACKVVPKGLVGAQLDL